MKTTIFGGCKKNELVNSHELETPNPILKGMLKLQTSNIDNLLKYIQYFTNKLF